MSNYTQSYRPFYQIRDRHHFIVRFINFWAGGFSDNGFNSMLSLGISFLRVVGAYKSYAEFVPWQFVKKYC